MESIKKRLQVMAVCLVVEIVLLVLIVVQDQSGNTEAMWVLVVVYAALSCISGWNFVKSRDWPDPYRRYAGVIEVTFWAFALAFLMFILA